MIDSLVHIQQSFRSVRVLNLVEMVESGRLNPQIIQHWASGRSLFRKSRIIEAIILGLPMETVWCEQDAFGEIQLLSGFDVVTSIIDFHSENLVLQDLKMLSHLEGVGRQGLNYLEFKNYSQAQINFGFIHHESNLMLRCLLIENINRDQYGLLASQLARSIAFKNGSNLVRGLAENIFVHFSTSLGKVKTARHRFIKEKDVLLALLLVLLSGRKIDFNLKLPSYIEFDSGFSGWNPGFEKSRMSSNDAEYAKVWIRECDDIEYALNKVMYLLEAGYLNLEFNRVKQMGNDFRYNSIGRDRLVISMGVYQFFEHVFKILTKRSELNFALKAAIERNRKKVTVKHILDFLID